MDQVAALRRFVAAIDQHDWELAFQDMAEDVRFNIPNSGVRARSREEAKKTWSTLVERHDAHYSLVSDPVENGHFTVGMLDTNALDPGGSRTSLPAVVVIRWRDEKIIEVWGFR